MLDVIHIYIWRKLDCYSKLFQSQFTIKVIKQSKTKNQPNKKKNPKKHMIFGGFNEMSSNIVYTSCYKNPAIKNHFLNLITTKHNMFQVSSKN